MAKFSGCFSIFNFASSSWNNPSLHATTLSWFSSSVIIISTFSTGPLDAEIPPGLSVESFSSLFFPSYSHLLLETYTPSSHQWLKCALIAQAFPVDLHTQMSTRNWLFRSYFIFSVFKPVFLISLFSSAKLCSTSSPHWSLPWYNHLSCAKFQNQ